MSFGGMQLIIKDIDINLVNLFQSLSQNLLLIA